MGIAITTVIIAALVMWAMGTAFTTWYNVKFVEEFLVREMSWPKPDMAARLACVLGALMLATLFGLGRGLELLRGRHEILVTRIRRQTVYGQVILGNGSRLKAHAYLIANGHSREEADVVLTIGPRD